jgi:hypothetical protein
MTWAARNPLCQETLGNSPLTSGVRVSKFSIALLKQVIEHVKELGKDLAYITIDVANRIGDDFGTT